MRILSAPLAVRFGQAAALAAACVIGAWRAQADSPHTPAPGTPSAAQSTPAATAPGATVPLTIVGESITSLSLEDVNGRVQRVPIVGGTVALAPGEYSVADVQVAGGWRYRSSGGGRRFSHSAEAPARLTLGAPLRGKVRITPSKRRIELNYCVVDAEGREYSGCPAQPPRVEIYAEDRLIASGHFRSG